MNKYKFIEIPVFTKNQYTYLTYYHLRPQNHMDSEFIVCKMGYSLKSRVKGRVRGRKTQKF